MITSQSWVPEQASKWRNPKRRGGRHPLSALGLGLLGVRSVQGKDPEGGPAEDGDAELAGPWGAGTDWRRAKRTPGKGVRQCYQGKASRRGWSTETEERNRSKCLMVRTPHMCPFYTPVRTSPFAQDSMPK